MAGASVAAKIALFRAVFFEITIIPICKWLQSCTSLFKYAAHLFPQVLFLFEGMCWTFASNSNQYIRTGNFWQRSMTVDTLRPAILKQQISDKSWHRPLFWPFLSYNVYDRTTNKNRQLTHYCSIIGTVPWGNRLWSNLISTKSPYS